MQYGLVDSKCMHLLWDFKDNDVELVDNIMKYPRLGSSHLIQYLSSGYKRELNHNMLK